MINLQNFIYMYDPYLIELWKDVNNRKDPQPGDLFEMNDDSHMIIVFDDIYLDTSFDNGIAFIYQFHRQDNNEPFTIRSINDVYNISQFNEIFNEKYSVKDLFGFWKRCKPYVNS